MRIKINDKIYRLKEIESGVDSLMELVEEPQYKEGDFVYEDGRIMIVKSYPNIYHANVWPIFPDAIVYNEAYGLDFSEPTFRYATAEEKQELIELLRKDGKRWNEAKKCVDDIPTYKRGDFLVKEYKDGWQYILILDYIDDDGLIYYHCCHSCKNDATYVAGDYGIGMIGDARHKCLRYATDREKELLLAELSIVGKRWNEKNKCIEDWIEPYVEELEKGDLAIFWDSDKSEARIGVYNQFDEDLPFPHKDHIGDRFINAVKFESKKQFKRFIKGKL